MSEPECPGPPQDRQEPLQSWLESLRSEGAWRVDPARFRYLEALARRLPDQPPPVRRLLQVKLKAGLAEYAQRLSQTQQAAGDEAQRLAGEHPQLDRELRQLQATSDLAGMRRLVAQANAAAACAPLARLNQSVRDASANGRGAEGPGETRDPHELASVRRFRRSWSSHRAQDQLDQAASRKPANAGPLNSHALVLHALALMRELSPDYLRRFMVQVEALQWLERASEKYPPRQARQSKQGKTAKAATPAGRSRPKK